MFAHVVLVAALFSPPTGDAQLRRTVGGAELVLRTTARLAGAVDSLVWNGVEFVDSVDHGRQIQSASAFDLGRPGPFIAETYNPTEAGSRDDHVGPTSTSRLLRQHVTTDTLETVCRMAFWLAPGQLTEGVPGQNTTRLSQHTLTKRITLGSPDLPHALDYRVTFTVPTGEFHTRAQFEALTAYMPPTFSQFEVFDSKSGRLRPLDDGPGEQPQPIVFSRPNGTHALGVVSFDHPAPGYGRWRFVPENVVKWNVVFRVDRPTGVPAGDYPFRLKLVIGTREDVRRTLAELIRRHGR